jgi:hypothetical protein
MGVTGSRRLLRARSARDAFERIPDPYRGWIGGRRARRWVRAVRFARGHNATLPPDAPRVSFFPMRLEPTAALAHVLPRLGIRIAPFPGEADLTVAWHTGTWIDDRDVRRLPDDALNRRCVDISKATVDKLWADAAGYSIAVDPGSWRGPLVVKPLANAVRGGRIVDGPLPSSRADVVYERLVDSREGERIHSTRAIVACGEIIVAYDRWRPTPNWFAGPEETTPAAAEDLYSADERATLVRFAQLIGLDFGEIDVIRDNDSGLIYGVDANRTPVRPRSLPAQYDDAVFGPMSAAFARLLGHA